MAISIPFYKELEMTLDNADLDNSKKIDRILILAKVTDLDAVQLPPPQSPIEEHIARRFKMFLADVAVAMLGEEIQAVPFGDLVNNAYNAISCYVLDPRILTPLVVLWAAGRASRSGMEPSLAMTQILMHLRSSEDKTQCFDLKYAFRDKDILKSFNAVRDIQLVSPHVRQDFLLSMKQMLTYLRNADRDFRGGKTLTEVEKYL